MQTLPRPAPGTVTTNTIRVAICGTCGRVIQGPLCSYGCPEDGGPHPHKFHAVYERTEKFLRDESSENGFARPPPLQKTRHYREPIDLLTKVSIEPNKRAKLNTAQRWTTSRDPSCIVLFSSH